MTQFVLTTVVGGTKVVVVDQEDCYGSPLWAAYERLVLNNAQFPDLGVSATLVLNELSRTHIGPEGILLLSKQMRMVGLVRPIGTEVHQFEYALILYLRSPEGSRWVENLRAIPF